MLRLWTVGQYLGTNRSYSKIKGPFVQQSKGHTPPQKFGGIHRWVALPIATSYLAVTVVINCHSLHIYQTGKYVFSIKKPVTSMSPRVTPYQFPVPSKCTQMSKIISHNIFISQQSKLKHVLCCTMVNYSILSTLSHPESSPASYSTILRASL